MATFRDHLWQYRGVKSHLGGSKHSLKARKRPTERLGLRNRQIFWSFQCFLVAVFALSVFLCGDDHSDDHFPPFPTFRLFDLQVLPLKPEPPVSTHQGGPTSPRQEGREPELSLSTELAKDSSDRWYWPIRQ